MISKERVKELIDDISQDIKFYDKKGYINLTDRDIEIKEILRSELERQEGCKYCNEKNPKRIEAEIYKGDYITIEKYEDYCLDIEFWENDVKTTGLIKIQYCPMCGRKLGGE